MRRNHAAEAQQLATLLGADGWDAGAFGDGVRVRLYARRTHHLGGVTFFTHDGEWVATREEGGQFFAGDRPPGVSPSDATFAWARAVVREYAETLGATSAVMAECPHCHGYGSSLQETAERCSVCGGSGVAAG